MLPIIQDDAITALIQLTHGTMSYANYNQHFNDILRLRSQQPFIDDFQCACFIESLSNFHLHTHAMSHHSQQNGYGIPLVELPNDLVTDSPNMGRAEGAPSAFDNRGGN
jgi:hypothetical protein